MRVSYTACNVALSIGFVVFIAYLSIAISPNSHELMAPVLQYSMSIIGCELMWGGMLGLMATTITSSDPRPGIATRFAAPYLILFSVFLFFNFWYLGYIYTRMQLLMGVANPNRPLFELILLGLAIGFMLSGIITAVGQVLGSVGGAGGGKPPRPPKPQRSARNHQSQHIAAPRCSANRRRWHGWVFIVPPHPTRSKVRIVKGIFPKLKCCYLCNYGL